MDDVEFQNMLGALTSLLPSQLVALVSVLDCTILKLRIPAPAK
jgi:hypothetical protein